MLGTEADGVLGKSDKEVYDKIDFENGKNYPILPIIRLAMWCKGYRDGDINDEICGDLNFL